MVRLFIILISLGASFLAQAQNIEAFATARANRSEVLLEQSLKVTIKVYTATWFTEGLDIENIQIEGAFIQSFKQTHSSIAYINNKKYASIEFYYIVFPYRTGTITIPELAIDVETPAIGDYKGQKAVLKTKKIVIDVKDIPKNADKDHWLVASNARISEQWSNNRKTLHVGDVLERTIVTRAYGTLPSFIDEPIIGEIDFATVYTSEPEYNDLRDDNTVNGKRTDKYSYLLEEEGEFIIPEVEVSWYNPYAGKLYKRTLPSTTISVAHNENMAQLQLLKDSLNAMNAVLPIDDVEGKTDYKAWIYKGIYLLLFILGALILFRITYSICKRIFKHRKQYKNSEPFWFKKMINSSSEARFITTIYQWIDHSPWFKKPTTDSLSANNKALKDSLTGLKQKQYSSTASKDVNPRLIKGLIRKQRNTIKDDMGNNKSKQKPLNDNINP